MRSRLASLLLRALAVALVPALALAACGGGESTTPAAGTSPSPTDASTAGTGTTPPAPGTASPAAAGLPTVEGEPGEKPVVRAPAGAPPAQLASEVLVEGTGPEVGKGDLLVAHYLGQTWREDAVFDNSYDRGQPVGFPIGTGQVIPGWDETLVGVPTGSRVLLSIPPDKGYGPQGNPQGGIKGDDTLVFVVDVLASYGPTAAAEGGKAASSPAGLPTVSGGAGGKPEVTIPDGARPPEELESAVLVEGTGPEVEEGQLLVAQYVGLTWRDAKEFDSSWDRGQPAAFPIGKGQVIPGWDETLVGVPTGSRVLLSIPPDKGYGTRGNAQAGIKGDDTLVFVVDVLGAH